MGAWLFIEHFVSSPTQTDALDQVEKTHSYKSDHIDFVQQHIRRFCLNCILHVLCELYCSILVQLLAISISMKTYMCFMVGNGVCICHKCIVSNVSFVYNKNLNGISIRTQNSLEICMKKFRSIYQVSL